MMRGMALSLSLSHGGRIFFVGRHTKIEGARNTHTCESIRFQMESGLTVVSVEHSRRIRSVTSTPQDTGIV